MKHRQVFATLISAMLIWAGFATFATFATTASAAVVATHEALSMEQQQGNRASVQATLARSDVRQAMIHLGVDPAHAQARVESLNDRELATLAGQLDRLPAGGSLLGLIGAVFVVLLILEVTGVIDIFKKV